LASVLGDEPDIGKQGSGWGQTRVVDILQSKVWLKSSYLPSRLHPRKITWVGLRQVT